MKGQVRILIKQRRGLKILKLPLNWWGESLELLSALHLLFIFETMATRRRTSATRKTAKSATPIVKESRATVKKVTTTAPKRVNKVTPKEVIKVTEVTPTPVKDTLNLEKLLKDYPRDGFALALLPLLLLEALTKEGLKLAGVSV